MSYKVYQHLFPNGKSYVGITCQPVKRRWRKGKSYSSNLRLTNAIKKYGWDNIQHIIIADGLSQEEACDIEIKMIAEMKLNDPQNGYNIAPGGEHPVHSEETKRKIAEKSRGRTHSEEFKKWISKKNSGSNNFMYGKHHKDETKRKISEVKRSHHLSSVNKGKFGSTHPSSKRIAGIDIYTNQIIKIYDCIKEASEDFGKSKSCLQAALHGRQKTCGGLKWVYL